MKETILVVDDDDELVDFLEQYLEKDGYKVTGVYSGYEALDLFRRREFDLIVLDLMLPEIDGFKVGEKMSQESDVPIIMLTARTTEEDKIKGLELGADDYITKPFSPGELLARIRAVLRRVEDTEEPEEVCYDNITVNFRQREVLVNNQPIKTTPTEFKILEALVKQPRRAFSRTDLIHAALGYGYEGFQRTIDVHIKHLREKIEDNPQKPTYIKTIYGVGYKFDPGGTKPD